MIIKSQNLVKIPLVSIVICSYNRSDLIVKTIDSILKQNCDFLFEVIIGDDASTDNVKEVLINYQKNYSDKIILLLHEKNIGLGANWASCVKLCRGKYLAGCDNDDFWHDSEKLKLQVQFLEKNSEYGMVHSDYRELNRKTGRISEKIIHNETYKESIINTIYKGKFKCCNSSVMYRKSLIDKNIFLEDYISYQFPLQDWNTWISLANFTKFYCLPVSTTTIGVEMESITRPKDYETVKQRFAKEKIMYKYLCDKFTENLPFDEKRYDYYVIKVLLSVAYKNEDFLEAKMYGHIAKELGDYSIKVRITSNRVLFYLFCYLKKLKKYFTYIND